MLYLSFNDLVISTLDCFYMERMYASCVSVLHHHHRSASVLLESVTLISGRLERRKLNQNQPRRHSLLLLVLIADSCITLDHGGYCFKCCGEKVFTSRLHSRPLLYRHRGRLASRNAWYLGIRLDNSLRFSTIGASLFLARAAPSGVAVSMGRK
ncbi:hypothetical protein BT96DRAFT_304184 [Gymnopus androsaceus JB14]|uniref:Uncharacterized protein n=1 Tax=Gymnopus androsaceus JB14 TaxID=1447944 RepID=A0A6A4H0D2_9AGAR|nr:hypothetical protein BT96DRAFT_304184 [Gymnopus androsaceus JB14]